MVEAGGVFRVLGIYVEGDPIVALDKMWTELMAKSPGMEVLWIIRVLTLNKKVAPVNSLLLSKWLYPLAITPAPE